jgi:hypothetical protein
MLLYDGDTSTSSVNVLRGGRMEGKPTRHHLAPRATRRLAASCCDLMLPAKVTPYRFACRLRKRPCSTCLLPAARELSAHATALSVKHERAAGREISCRPIQ